MDNVSTVMYCLFKLTFGVDTYGFLLIGKTEETLKFDTQSEI